MFLQTETNRRQFLTGGLTAGSLAAAYLAVGCSEKEKEERSKVSQPSPVEEETKVSKPNQVASTRAADYLINWFQTWPSQGSKAWHPAAVSSLFALSLAGREKEVVFADGAGIDHFLAQASIDQADLSQVTKVLNQLAYIDLSRGRLPDLRTRESHLSKAITDRVLDGKNAAMFYSIVLNRWLQTRGYGNNELAETLLERVLGNRQRSGWCSDQSSGELIDQLPNVDTNAMAVMAGAASISSLELGRQGQGWRHFVDDPDSRVEANLESTVAIGWARGLGKESLGFVLGLQTADGSFRHNNSDSKGYPGPTAEALAYIASRTHPIFGKSPGNQLSRKESWLLTTC